MPLKSSAITVLKQSGMEPPKSMRISQRLRCFSAGREPEKGGCNEEA